MSISSAPSDKANCVSASFTARLARPLGKAVATAATATPSGLWEMWCAPSDSRTEETMSPYTQTAATDGVEGSLMSGEMAFLASVWTLPTVSAPSSVVRSTIEMMVSKPAAFDVVFSEREANPAARAWAPTVSTPGMPLRKVVKAFSVAPGPKTVWARGVCARAVTGFMRRLPVCGCLTTR